MLRFLVIIAAAGGFLFFTPVGKQITGQAKARVVSVIDPAFEQRSSLSDLSGTLSKMSDTINSSTFQRSSQASQVRQLNSLLDEAQGALEQAQDKAKNGDTASTLNALIQKIIPVSQPATPTICPSPSK
ncbi:MAG TPA: hypothetical protein VFK07_02275 [Candidatus Paceibacterota bacterium]|nr:hypothetical protein [Candidatus Paceibacterota bacterium]